MKNKYTFSPSSTHARQLYRALASLTTEAEIKAFLRDLCTVDEIQEMARRFEAATMVSQNISYREIAKKTGLSTATVTRVAHWLHHGKGGYKKALLYQD